MSMFGAKSGSWGLRSEEDPRWNCSGTSSCILIAGGYPKELEDKLKKLTEKYGPRPSDLSVTIMKD